MTSAIRQKRNLRVPPYCKKDLVLLDQLLTAFVVYDALSGESITMHCLQRKVLPEH